jgi:beta-lactamase regulating signal transducer with metallopeptidase domain
MELYLLKSAGILTILFVFYKVVLENTSIHIFKRFYLFGSLVAAFLIPLITFTSYVEISPTIPTYTEATPQLSYTEVEKTVNYWPFVLWTVYGLGVLFFSIKFFRNLFNLIQQIRKNPKYKNSSFIHVLLNETVIPHTFFNYIFLNKKQFENHEIPREVIFHEETHARQKHSLDIIFVELLQIVFWFNPLFSFIKKSIKLNHEFLADRAVLKAGAETSDYQKILLAFSSNAATPSLANSLNYSSIKKRFTLMKTHTSKRAIWLRSLLILPLLSVLIYGFSTKEIVKKEIQQEIVQQKASEVEIAEYNKLAKKYNAVDIEKRIIPMDDLNLLETIYRKMTLAQRAQAHPFPECNQTQKYAITEDNKKFSEANYYYKGERITFEKANELLNENNDFGIYIDKSGNGPGTVHIYQEPFDIDKITPPSQPTIPVVPKVKKGEKSNIPPAPPAPKTSENTTYNFSGTVNTNIPVPSTPSFYNPKKDVKFDDNTVFMYDDLVIPIEKATVLLLDRNNELYLYIQKEDGREVARLSKKPFKNATKIKPFLSSSVNTPKTPSAENGNLYMAAEAPPAPNPYPVQYIKELGKRGATFYIGPHKYSTDEAIKMVEKSTNEVTIDVSQYPKVILGGC